VKPKQNKIEPPAIDDSEGYAPNRCDLHKVKYFNVCPKCADLISVAPATPQVIDQPRNETRAVLPAESCHWYDKAGQPRYTIIGKNGKERSTTLRDAREHGWLPSVTEILNVAAKPGLEAWKSKQILEAALTLPRLTDESLDDYATRVIEDSKVQGKKAMERGTELHAAIEQNCKVYPFDYDRWGKHIEALHKACTQYGIDLHQGKAEHSFASPLGYGGKIDFWQDEPLVCDFKTKDFIEEKKQLSWPEHIQQLSAYGMGLLTPYNLSWPRFRAINVFVGCSDCQVRIIEHSWEDILDAWEQFKLLLEYWMRTKKFGKYAKTT
jgi:hypothetical protein